MTSEMISEVLIKVPFKRVRQCIEMIDRINSDVINDISNIIRSEFIDFVKHQYGVEVYELSDSAIEVQGDFIVLADVRDIRWLIAYICGAYELGREYKIETAIRPIYVKFVPWLDVSCMVHCGYSTMSNKLTIMPMTAAILGFPEVIRARVKPL